jgi:hypothetical protein
MRLSNPPRGHGDNSKKHDMKTLLSILVLLALGTLALGTLHLNFGDSAMVAMAAAMFGLAFIDGGQTRRPSPRLI